MIKTTRYFIEITERNGKYNGIIHQGNAAIARDLENLQIGPDAEIQIKENSYKMGALIETLIGYKQEDLKIAFEERGQLEIGQFMYGQIFNKIIPTQLKQQDYEQIDLRIVTENEHIARLPWVLLAHKGIFLAAAGWSVSLAQTPEIKDCELPENPRMLIIAPEPAAVEKTESKSHLDTLEYRLSSFNHRLSRVFFR